MKRPIFIMLVLVAIAFAGPMLMKKPDGTPFMEAPWQSSDSSNSAPSINSNQSFYKWQDEDGTWHYSDQPQVGKNIETVTVNINTNLIQGLRIEKKEEKVIEKEVKKPEPESPSIPLPMTVPMEKVSKMLEDASNMQQVMDNRNKQIEQATRGR
jgi:sporulation protein YlmC with PRC-barrel domain